MSKIKEIKISNLILFVIITMLFIWRLGYELHKAELVFYGLVFSVFISKIFQKYSKSIKKEN
ncbi:MAG: hypothetical protein GX752_08870 [Clostridium sp.]|nr:hypothetical protein [Clostridium sp.]